MKRTAILTALVLVLAAPCGAPGVAAGRDEAIDLDALVGTEWYGIYLLERKVGYACVTFELSDLDGVPVLVETARMRLLMKVGGQKMAVRIEMCRAHAAEPPYRLLLVQNEERTSTSLERLRVTRDGDEFLVTRLLHGRTTTQRVPASKETLHGAIAVERLVASGPAPGDSVSTVSFDEDKLADVEETAKVVEIVEEEWRGETRRVFVVETRDPDSTSVARYLDDGTLIDGSAGATVTLKLEDEATARRLPAEGELFELRRKIAVTGLDVDGDKVRTLTLAVEGMPDGVVPDLPTQRVERRDDGALVLTLTPAVVPLKPSVGDDDRERLGEYLEATDEIQSDHARIRSRARRIIGRKRSPVVQAWALNRWVHRHVQGTEFCNCETALDVLTHLKGDCTEHALLFVALCRAAGLPAREVSGLVYTGPAEHAFAMHRWAQVYVGAWVDVDPTLNQFPADATHIALDTAGEGWFELLAAFPETRIEVLSVE
jgi:hypothetical protein